jgi:hypothetical protein
MNSLLFLLVLMLSTLKIVFSQDIDLGSCINFAVLGGSGISSTGNTVVNGVIGSYPTATINGFAPGTNTGVGSIPACQTAQGDLTIAYNLAVARAPTMSAPSELGSSTFTPGVYNSSSGFFMISTPMTLNGSGTYIFKTATTVTTSANMVLINGAHSSHIFWQVGSSATLGSTTIFYGTIMAYTAISLDTGATVYGRLLASNAAVSMIANVITPQAAPTSSSSGSGSSSISSSSRSSSSGISSSSTSVATVPSSSSGLSTGSSTRVIGGSAITFLSCLSVWWAFS